MRARALAGFAIAAMALCLAALAGAQAQRPVNARLLLGDAPAARLSDYRLFLDSGARTPNARVTPYGLNTELYADGAVKFRYVFIPPGAQAQYHESEVFAFPVGTALIKTFAAPGADGTMRFLETRLLIHRDDGWVAYPYVWNEAQSEAVYSPIGAEIPVAWRDAAGDEHALAWRVPNRNQCKGCHDRDGVVAPIGPSARNLNRDYPYAEGAANQLTYWATLGLLAGAPAPSDAPRAPDAYAADDAPLALRARTYLDVNCAHCHNPRGPAATSGLDLRLANEAAYSWGVMKPPVAAGRASAGMAFSIEPGHPERSILLHRMESLDPGVMMPELGRQTVDARAVALIREWIAEME
ncbi:MAG: hypothetical protein HXY28_01760 [Hydrogenophilaceae bacterium]|jgi:uncharacterized repeat protein (TIGR03806 family)|nr:hypothetical protein [Hydrogenophilaceae bacterium]